MLDSLILLGWIGDGCACEVLCGDAYGVGLYRAEEPQADLDASVPMGGYGPA
jgi:hypothetical protein